MGERAVDAVLDSKRDDDLESSLVLAVAVVMVGTVLVGDGREDMVELLEMALRWMSAEEREPVKDVSLGKNEVSSPRRGLCLAAPIVSACFSAALVVVRLSSFPRRHSSRDVFQVSVGWSFFFLFGRAVEESASRPAPLCFPTSPSSSCSFSVAQTGSSLPLAAELAVTGMV